MKTVFEAIYQKTIGTGLSAAISGRFYPMQAPVGSASPLVVCSVISETSDYLFASAFLAVLVEFSVYATDIGSMQAVALLVDQVFNGCILQALDGYVQLGPMDRDNAQPLIIDNVFRYIIEYKLNLQKTS